MLSCAAKIGVTAVSATLLQGLGVNLPDLPPLFVYGFVLVGFVVTNLLLAHLLGPKKKTPVKDMPYESGMDPCSTPGR